MHALCCQCVSSIELCTHTQIHIYIYIYITTKPIFEAMRRVSISSDPATAVGCDKYSTDGSLGSTYATWRSTTILPWTKTSKDMCWVNSPTWLSRPSCAAWAWKSHRYLQLGTLKWQYIVRTKNQNKPRDAKQWTKWSTKLDLSLRQPNNKSLILCISELLAIGPCSRWASLSKSRFSGRNKHKTQGGITMFATLFIQIGSKMHQTKSQRPSS